MLWATVLTDALEHTFAVGSMADRVLWLITIDAGVAVFILCGAAVAKEGGELSGKVRNVSDLVHETNSVKPMKDFVGASCGALLLSMSDSLPVNVLVQFNKHFPEDSPRLQLFAFT
jgi:hypothetical protein